MYKKKEENPIQVELIHDQDGGEHGNMSSHSKYGSVRCTIVCLARLECMVLGSSVFVCVCACLNHHHRRPPSMISNEFSTHTHTQILSRWVFFSRRKNNKSNNNRTSSSSNLSTNEQTEYCLESPSTRREQYVPGWSDHHHHHDDDDEFVLLTYLWEPPLSPCQTCANCSSVWSRAGAARVCRLARED